MQVCELRDGYGPALRILSSAIIACCRTLLPRVGDLSCAAPELTELGGRLFGCCGGTPRTPETGEPQYCFLTWHAAAFCYYF